MILRHFGPALLLGGLLLTVGMLFLLQRLRVRHRRLEVPTTLFWREAREEIRARVLVERFRHWKAWLLLVGAAALLWLGAADPRLPAPPSERNLILLDGSAALAWEARRAEVVETLLADLEDLDPEVREVWWSGSRPARLLAPGEPLPLLEERLEGLEAEAVPARLEEAAAAALAAAEARPGALWIYGDGAFDPAALAGSLEGVELRRRETGRRTGANQGLVAAGVAAAASGRADRLDLLAATTGSAVEADPALPVPETAGEAGGRRVFRFRDLPADGREIRLRAASGDALALDDAGRLRLPERPPLRVFVAPGVPLPLQQAVLAAPGVEGVASVEAAEVVLRRAEDGRGSGLPALVVDPEEGPGLRLRAPAPARDLLARAPAWLGLGELDALALAEARGRELRLVAEEGEVREVALAWDLLLPETGLIESRAFPALVGRALAWLAPRPPASAAEVEVLGDPVASGAAPAGLAASAAAPDSGGGFEPAVLFLLLALALLLLEDRLYRRGRVP